MRTRDLRVQHVPAHDGHIKGTGVFMFGSMIKGGMAMVAVAAATQAHARFVVVDQAPYQSFTPCSSNRPCTNFFSTTSEADSWTEKTNNNATTVNFTLNYGNGGQTRIYAYDNGLFSVGAPLAGTPGNVQNFAAIGNNVFSPLYYASGLTTNGYQYSYGQLDNLNGQLTGRDFLRIRYNVVYNGVTSKIEVQLVEGDNPGDFLMFYGYGESQHIAEVPNNALIGFQLGANADNKKAGDYQPEIRGVGNGNPFAYSFANAATSPVVPEPATWAMMIVGFGAVGVCLRRRLAAVPGGALTSMR